MGRTVRETRRLRRLRRDLRRAGVRLDWGGGYCPVQLGGTIRGTPLYFRSRGDRWTVEIGPMCHEWRYSRPYGRFPDAGYLPSHLALAFLLEAALAYGAARAVVGHRAGFADDATAACVAAHLARMRTCFGARDGVSPPGPPA